MKHQFFVYLIVSENRLVILKHEVKNQNYVRLMDNNGTDPNILESLCKTFCLGFILGSGIGKKPINNLWEFE